jgi:membrane protease YdiL (CAAX protease family)
MITQSFYVCIATIVVSGILQSSYIVMHSLKKRVLGSMIFLMGLIPAWINPPASGMKAFGLDFIYHEKAAMITLVLSVLIATINWFSAGTQGNMAVYPQIREPVWRFSLTLKSAFAWTIYLTLYEIIFRGVFLYAALRVMGFWPAVFLNVGLYSLAHLLKNKREALLSIPFGFLVIYLTWISGSCWYAVILHVVLALSHEWSSIRANPNMRFDFSIPPKHHRNEIQ